MAAVVGRPRAGSSLVEYLLVEEETPEGLRLNNPAGHLDPGESPEQAVVREVLEETSRRFVPDRLIGVYLARSERSARGEDITYLRFAYAGSVGAPERTRPLDRGIVRTLWQTLAELHESAPRHRSPLVLRTIQDCAAGKSAPLDVVVTEASVYGTRAP